MEREKVTQYRFMQLAMQRAAALTMKEFNMREGQSPNAHQWAFRDGAYMMCLTLLEHEFEVVEEYK